MTIIRCAWCKPTSFTLKEGNVKLTEEEATYLAEKNGIRFTDGQCPDCFAKIMNELNSMSNVDKVNIALGRSK